MAVGGAIAWYVLNPGSSLTTADPLPAKVAPPSSVADRAKAVADAAQAEVERRAPAAAAAWEQVKTSSEVAALDAFVARFGDTTYGELAKSRLANLRQEQARVAAAAEAKRRADEAEQQRVAALQKQEDDRRRAEAAAAEAKRKAHEEARGRDPVAALAPGSGRSARDCPVCPEMVVVPAGRFTMGSPANELERYADETQVAVTIARAFAVGRFAVTFAEWDACVADGGCGGYKPDDEKWGRGNRPVINVNWNDAKAYVAWLSKKTGKSYRLLSEAEREYVARAGTTTPFWWGGTITPRQANYDGNFQYAGGGAKGEYRRRTVPVDSFEANPWGLHQVHGNVWEWTEDCWNGSNAGNPGDGSARTSGACSQRVVRGGSWYYGPRGLRSALRIWFTTVDRDYDRGFRVGRSVVP
jgi:formylglycine-generating enzyme required for sulfatase activity